MNALNWQFDKAKYVERFRGDEFLRHDDKAPNMVDRWRDLVGSTMSEHHCLAEDDHGDHGYSLVSNGWVIEWGSEGGALWEPLPDTEGATSVPVTTPPLPFSAPPPAKPRPAFHSLWRVIYRDDQDRRCTTWIGCDSKHVLATLRAAGCVVAEVHPETGALISPEVLDPTE
jgi:hypothetical protein